MEHFITLVSVCSRHLVMKPDLESNATDFEYLNTVWFKVKAAYEARYFLSSSHIFFHTSKCKNQNLTLKSKLSKHLFWDTEFETVLYFHDDLQKMEKKSGFKEGQCGKTFFGAALHEQKIWFKNKRLLCFQFGYFFSTSQIRMGHILILDFRMIWPMCGGEWQRQVNGSAYLYLVHSDNRLTGYL